MTKEKQFTEETSASQFEEVSKVLEDMIYWDVIFKQQTASNETKWNMGSHKEVKSLRWYCRHVIVSADLWPPKDNSITLPNELVDCIISYAVVPYS